MDGKHVVIQAPHNSGSQYFNYKGTYSVVLLVVVDARYLFRVVGVGAIGRNSDGGTLAASAFGQPCGKRSCIPQKMLLSQVLITWGPCLMYFCGRWGFSPQVSYIDCTQCSGAYIYTVSNNVLSWVLSLTLNRNSLWFLHYLQHYILT